MPNPPVKKVSAAKYRGLTDKCYLLPQDYIDFFSGNNLFIRSFLLDMDVVLTILWSNKYYDFLV